MASAPSLTFTEHLQELRGRLIICAVAVALCTGVAIPFADDVVMFLAKPLEALASAQPEAGIRIALSDGAVSRVEIPPGFEGQVVDPAHVPLIFEVTESGASHEVVYGRRSSSRLYYFGLTDPIYLIFKTALLMGLVLAMPVVGWQAWLFIAPGLTDRERAAAKPVIWLFAVSFPLGAAFAHWVLQYAVVVLMRFSFGGLELLPDIGRYLAFMVTMMIAFGFVFEMPGVLWMLGRLGVVSAEWLAGKRRWAIILSFVIAGIVTPTPDVFTQLSMALPLIVLFEFSILLIRWTAPRPLPPR
ncbi:MAG: twin-arginine translocase subunit TatC [Candidatus Sumerlaeia bacterium]|nr:twin-arginine translocase subunit TatC [Candidatus Sumerlaeia bacterium]